MITKKEAIALKKRLSQWSKEYYTTDNSSISDSKYDNELKLLIEYENLNPDFITKDSPTQKIGSPISKGFNKFVHLSKMFSLSNAFNKEDLLDFDKRIKKITGKSKQNQYICELKIDGVSISVHYENGILKNAVTRGDGIQGENITKNILQIKDIPNTIPYKNKLEVRGEIFLKKSEFNILNLKEKRFANPRNAAAGTIRQHDSRIVSKRNLSSYFYSITNIEQHKIYTQSDILNFLKDNKFNVNKEYKVFNNMLELTNNIDKFETSRDGFDYEIDGVVVKINDVNLYDEIGYTSKFPKFMIAYKFQSQIVSTKLISIYPTIGRTGRVTYNAALNPINLMGSVISAATLHNAEYIRNINININDDVNIKKAGDIIPKVISLSKKNNNDIWTESKECPSCKKELIRIPKEVDQYCINKECPAIIKSKLEHFVSRNAMNIEGLGPKLIELLYDANFLNSFSSLYKLKDHYDELIKINNLGEVSINKLLDSIENSKKQNLDKFMFALGIRHLGQKVSKIFASKFLSIKTIRNLNYEDIIDIHDIGAVVSDSLVKYFNSKENNEILDELISLGVNIFYNSKNTKNYLNNMIFVITGKLKNSREYYSNIIYDNGGKLTNTISKKTNYLLKGEKPGSKINAAKLFNVKIINENEFSELLKGFTNER